MKSLLVIGAALCSVASVLSFRPEIQEASPVAGTQFYYLQAKGYNPPALIPYPTDLSQRCIPEQPVCQTHRRFGLLRPG